VPVTLKIRTGWDNWKPYGIAICQIAQATYSIFAVHGRTRPLYVQRRCRIIRHISIKQLWSNLWVVALSGEWVGWGNRRAVKQRVWKTHADVVNDRIAAQGLLWIFSRDLHFSETGQRLLLQYGEVSAYCGALPMFIIFMGIFREGELARSMLGAVFSCTW